MSKAACKDHNLTEASPYSEIKLPLKKKNGKINLKIAKISEESKRDDNTEA